MDGSIEWIVVKMVRVTVRVQQTSFGLIKKVNGSCLAN